MIARSIRTPFWCFTSILISFLVLAVLILSSKGTHGDEDYSVEAWSDDLQLTNGTNTSYPFKGDLEYNELSDGTIDILFQKVESSNPHILPPGILSEVRIDKMGNIIQHRDVHSSSINPIFPPVVRLEFYDYDESQNCVVFISSNYYFYNAGNLTIFRYDIDTGVIFEEICTTSDIGYSTNTETIPPSLFTYLTGLLDSHGRVHLITQVITEFPDGTNQTDLVYLLISWDPFHIQSKIIWSWPRGQMTGGQREWWYLDLTEDDQPVISYSIVKGIIRLNVITTVNETGAWNTQIINEIPYYPGLSGFMVDKDGLAHMVWYDPATQSLTYINATLDGQHIGKPVIVAWIPEIGYPYYIWEKIGKTSMGDLIFAYNLWPGASWNINYGNGEIDLVVVPNGDFTRPNILPIAMVKVPSAVECQLLVDEHDNLFLFWIDSRTGASQIYMKCLVRPGLSLEIDPADWASAPKSPRWARSAARIQRL